MRKQIRKFFAAIIVLCLITNGLSGTPLLAVSADVSTGLVAHYTFDGDLKDSSGNGNDGTKEGNAITFVDAKFGKGAKFDGASYITVEDSDVQDLDNQFSIVAWIYKEKSATNFAPVVTKGEADYTDISTPYALYYDYNGMRPLLRQATNVIYEEMYITELLQSNQRWHQLAVTKNGKSVNFYIDGVLSGTQICEAERLFASEGKLFIGASVVDFNAYFKGVMDDLRIYNRALSNDEIKAIMAGTAPTMIAAPTPTPTPTPTPAAETPPGTLPATSTPAPTPAPTPTPTPAPTPTPTPTPAPTQTPTTIPAPTSAPTPVAAPGAIAHSVIASVVAPSEGKMELISKASTGEPVYGELSSMSNDGRYVVFASISWQMVQSEMDIFVYDRVLKIVKNVSVSSTGQHTPGRSFGASISGDGRYVTYLSFDRNLVPNDDNGKLDVFYHDLQTGMTKRITNGNGNCFNTSISTDGRFIVFTSQATNLTLVDSNGDNADVFVYDRTTEKIEMVHVSSKGIQGDSFYFLGTPLSISDDGRYVAYISNSTNLVDDDTNKQLDMFIFDRQTKITERMTDNGIQFDQGCQRGVLSGDGRYVALYPEGARRFSIYDRQTKKHEYFDGWGTGTNGTGMGRLFRISSDGRYVVFSSSANLVPNVERKAGAYNIFILCLETRQIQIVDVAASGKVSDDYSTNPFVSSNGRYIAFESTDAELIGGLNISTGYNQRLVYLRDMSEDKTPPSWLAGSSLATKGVTRSEVTINWAEAADNIGIMGYKVYIDQALVGSTNASTRSYTAKGLRPGTSYTFRVEAFDQAENISTGGPAATVMTSK